MDMFISYGAFLGGYLWAVITVKMMRMRTVVVIETP